MQVDRAAAQTDREKLRQEDNTRATMSPHGPEEARAKQPPQQQQAKIGQQKDAGLAQQPQAGQVRAGASTETFKEQGQQKPGQQAAAQQPIAQQPLMQQPRAGEAAAKLPEHGKAGQQAAAKAEPYDAAKPQQQHGKDLGHEAPRVGKGDRNFDQSNKESADFSARERERGDIRAEDTTRQAQRETDRRNESSQQHRTTDMEAGKFTEAGDAAKKAPREKEAGDWDMNEKARLQEQAGRKNSKEQTGPKQEVEARFHEKPRS